MLLETLPKIASVISSRISPDVLTRVSSGILPTFASGISSINYYKIPPLVAWHSLKILESIIKSSAIFKNKKTNKNPWVKVQPCDQHDCCQVLGLKWFFTLKRKMHTSGAIGDASQKCFKL